MQAKKGDRVSLVLDKRDFFFQGKDGINLGMNGVDSEVIPESISDDLLNQINMAISKGDLVVGSAQNKIELPDRDSDIKAMLESGRNKINDWITKLAFDKTTSSKSKIEIIEKIIDIEKSGKNRTSVITCSENALKSIGGISKIEESEQEKIEIKLTSGTEEEQTEK